jgi:hypothetical protein
VFFEMAHKSLVHHALSKPGAGDDLVLFNGLSVIATGLEILSAELKGRPQADCRAQDLAAAAAKARSLNAARNLPGHEVDGRRQGFSDSPIVCAESHVCPRETALLLALNSAKESEP